MPFSKKTGFVGRRENFGAKESHAAAATPTTSKKDSGGGARLMRGGEGRGRLRLNSKIGQVESDRTVVV